MNNPLVTVAIPVFNAEKTIEIAVKSVLMQSYSNWELIIINDGSKDDSMNIINRFSDHRIRIIDDQINKGLVNRLNSIPSLARGKYIARMDADDIMHPKRLEMQVEYMESNPNLDVIDCAIYTINEANRIKGIRNTEDLSNSKIDLLNSCLFTHPAVLGKKEWFMKNMYDSNYYRAEDYELWLRAYDESNYGRIKTPLFFYREGNVNISNYISSMKSFRKIVRRYGPSLMSPFDKRIAIIKSYVKQYLYLTAGLFRVQKLLVHIRNNRLTPDQEKLSNFIIVEITKFKVNQF